MAERRRYGEIPVVQTARAQVTPTTTGVSQTHGLDVLAAGFAKAGEHIDDFLDRKAKAESAMEGQRAGTEQQMSLRDPTTISGAAFNQAALSTFLANTETRARGKVKEIYAQNFDNPQKLQQGLDAYMESQVKVLDNTAPGSVPEFRTKFSVWTQPFMSRASTNFKQNFIDGVKTSGVDLEAQTISDINDQAANIFSTDPQLSMSSQLAIGDSMVSLRSGLRQQVEGGSTVTEAQLGARAAQVFQNAVVAGTRSWFQSQPDKANAFLTWKTGEFKPMLHQPDGTMLKADVRRTMNAETQTALDSWMQQEFALSVSTAEGAERTMASLEKSERNIHEFNAWSMVYTDDIASRLKPADVAQLVRTRRIDPEAGKQMLEALNREEKQRDDDALVLHIENSIYDGANSRPTINTGFKDGRLSSKTASRLLALNQNQVYPDRDKPQDPYSRYRKLLHESTQQKGPMAVDFGGEPERRARAMIEFDQQVLDYKIDPKDAFDDVLARTKVGMGSLNLNTERLILPRFAVGGRDNLNIDETAKRLRQAFDNKRITQNELVEEVRRLNDWKQGLALSQQQAAAAPKKKGK